MWREHDIAINRDRADFRALMKQEQHAFTANLKRQIVLDTEQGRTPAIALLPIVSLPELEAWVQTWTFFESIHSRTYSHIIDNVYSDAGEVFDQILDIREIVNLRKSLARYADDLINATQLYNYFGGPGHLQGAWADEGCSFDHFDRTVSETELKKKLYLYLMSVNALEGIRFYSSFATSWSFAENKGAMEGNAKLIKLICRDENLHLAAVQHIIKLLPKDDPEFIDIARDCQDEVVEIFRQAVDEEREWNKYQFSEGSFPGMNEEISNTFVESRAAKIMKTYNLPTLYKAQDNLPWTKKWISGSDVQVAPQETEIVSYTSGALKQDVTTDTFKGFTL